MTNWITDRQPTEADGDKDRLVVARHDGLKDGQTLAYWDDLNPGTHWRHTYRWTPPVEQPATPDFKPGQVWRTRKGMTCEILQIHNGCKEETPIRSNLYGLHWHYLNGKSCLAMYGQDHEDDLVELIREAAPEPQSEPAPLAATSTTEIPEPIRTGAAPFYVLVVSDDHPSVGGQPIVWEHPVLSETKLSAVLRRRAGIGSKYGTTFIAECRIIPELTLSRS